MAGRIWSKELTWPQAHHHRSGNDEGLGGKGRELGGGRGAAAPPVNEGFK